MVRLGSQKSRFFYLVCYRFIQWDKRLNIDSPNCLIIGVLFVFCNSQELTNVIIF